MTHLNLVLFNGNQSQAPWNYLLNNPEFASQALAVTQSWHTSAAAPFDLGAARRHSKPEFRVTGALRVGCWDR